MTTAAKESSKEKNNSDVSTFLSDLNSAIDFRSSSRRSRRDSINRFYYTVGSANFLLEQNLDAENITKREINKIPHCKEWHEGIISVRGTIMPVINMETFLKDKIDIGSEEKEKKKHISKKNFLLVNHDEYPSVVLLVDELPRMVNIKDYSTQKVPNSPPDWIKSNLEGNNTIIEVDHSKLLNQIIKEQ